MDRIVSFCDHVCVNDWLAEARGGEYVSTADAADTVGRIVSFCDHVLADDWLAGSHGGGCVMQRIQWAG